MKLFCIVAMILGFGLPGALANGKTCEELAPFKLIEIYKFKINIPVRDKDTDKDKWTAKQLEVFETHGTAPEVSRILTEVNKVVPLIFGAYDNVSFENPAGRENFRPLAGSAGQSKTNEVGKYKTMQLSFSVPRQDKLRDQVLRAISWAHSYEEPVVNISEELETRTVPEFLKGGKCDTSPHKWYRVK